MAYIDQDTKMMLAPAINAVLKKYNTKGSISIQEHTTLVCNINEGPLDIIANLISTAGLTLIPQITHMQVNPYYIDNQYSGMVRQFLLDLKFAMDGGNQSRADIQSDFFGVNWYNIINIGKHSNPYQVV